MRKVVSFLISLYLLVKACGSIEPHNEMHQVADVESCWVMMVVLKLGHVSAILAEKLLAVQNLQVDFVGMESFFVNFRRI